MIVYVVIDNNHEEFEDYEEWVDGVFSTEENALQSVENCRQKYWQVLQETYAHDGTDLEYNQKYIKGRFEEAKESPARIEKYILDSLEGVSEN